MKRKPEPKPEEIEIHPDAWERFENAVDTVMRPPPRHRTARKKEPSPARRGKRGETKPA
jgi:hypothetical protein